MARSPRGTRRRDGLDNFSKRLFQQIVLLAHLGIHPLEPPVLFGHVLHLSNQRCIHSTEFGPPLIKNWRCSSHAPDTAQRLACRPLLVSKCPLSADCLAIACRAMHELCFAKSCCHHQNLLRYLAEEILLLNTTNLRGNYRRIIIRCGK
jgi:hypothetical protein